MNSSKISPERIIDAINNKKSMELIKDVLTQTEVAGLLGYLLAHDERIENYLVVSFESKEQPEFDYSLILVKRGKEVPSQAKVDACFYSREQNGLDKEVDM